MNNTAIILGAGSGTRMKCERSKLLLELDGATVIERSVRAFFELPFINNIIVVCQGGLFLAPQALWRYSLYRRKHKAGECEKRPEAY